MGNNNILKVNEIYKSIQGESTHTGLPCVFVRLTYCNLRCSYCDTEYAFHDGADMSIDQIITRIKPMRTKLIEITGGEPMLQDNTIPLMKTVGSGGFPTIILMKYGAMKNYKGPRTAQAILQEFNNM